MDALHLACHLPGGITSPSGLWDYVYNKKSAQCTVPLDRYNIEGFYHKDGSRAGVMSVDGGYFIQEDVRKFDPSFFGINNLEASYMDPQQRKLLEVVYECFENAGLSMEDVSGSNTAVFVGNFTVDYSVMQSRDTDYVHRLAATGGGTSIMSNRISHVFNLHGPSFTLDTACSSTIYALHQAVNAIKNGDCDAAIVAGANLITSPEQHFGTAKGGFLSPTSACHTFDTSADGYARAEALNAIYITRLSSAMKSDRKIHAVIRGTAINANGKTPGITLPDAKMQAAVIRKAYQNAGLSFADTDYVECHGTGTPVGDPIEVDGIAACFAGREGEPLRIGSVKTNMGHSEAASGLTSIIKVALAFEHGMIPPTYGVKNLNPKLKLKERNMKVLTEVEAWPRALRRAGVNSFGYGGANGHVILESIDSYFVGSLVSSPITRALSNPYESEKDYVVVIPFSASSGKSLEARRKQAIETVEKTEASALKPLAAAMSKRQTKMRLRDYVLASASSNSQPSLIDMTDVGDKASPGTQPLPFAFVFTGQGAQYANMAKELVEQDFGFLTSIRDLDEVLQSLPAEYKPSWTLEQTILDKPATSKINDVTRSQPICTAVQVSLVNMLQSWGVSPSAVIGHSSGEIAAAYGSGLLTASEAILAAYFRGFAVGQLQSRGAMMAVGITPDGAIALIEQLGLKEVRVACVNAPESVTLSGAVKDIDSLQAKLQKEKKFARKLETGGRAYHSHMMAEIGDLYESLVTPYITVKKVAEMEVKMFSTVGHSIDALGTVDLSTEMASYFRKNLEQPVQFSAGLANMITSNKYHLIEIGPHSALKGPIQQIRTSAKRDKEGVPYSPTLVRKENSYVCLKKLAGTLFSYGHSLDWYAVNNVPRYHALPTPPLASYPWDYSKPLPWHEPRASVEHRLRKHVRHELLGTRATAGNGIEWCWRNIPRMSEMPWLRDHKLGESQVVLPGAAYMAMAIEAFSQVHEIKGKLIAGEPFSFEFENVNISAAFVVPDENDAEADKTELHTLMSPRKISTANISGNWHEFSISSWVSGIATLHCMGSIRVMESTLKPKDGSVMISGNGHEVWGMSRWYAKAKEEGLNFGPTFQSLTSLHTDGNRTSTDSIATTLLDPPSAAATGMFYAVHPITIDACFQATIMGGTAGNINTLRAYVPVFVSSCSIQIPRGGSASLGEEEVRIHSRMEKTGFSTRAVSFTLRLPDGTPVIDMPHLRMNEYTGKAPVEPETSIYLQRQPCLRVQWKPDVLRLRPGSDGAIREYIASFAAQQSDDLKDNGALVVFAALLDLFGHKVPRMSVLELGQESQWTPKDCQSILGKGTAFPRFRLWNDGKLGDNSKIIVDNAKNSDSYDVVLIPHLSVSNKIWAEAADAIISLISDDGIIITRRSKDVVSALKTSGFVVLELPNETLVAVRSPKQTGLENKEVVIVKPNEASPSINSLATAVATHLKNAGVVQLRTVTIDSIETVNLNSQVVCVSLLEMEHEFLATINSEDMDRFRKITDNVGDLLWLTGANMLSTPNPDLTLSSGLSRALMLEQPALRYAILDVGADISKPNSMELICNSVSASLVFRHATDDKEFIQKDGIVYISRFVPDVELNALFRHRMTPDSMKLVPLREVGPAKLSIGQVGMTDTIHFQQISERKTTPPAGFVDVDLRAIGLNAKDVYALNGRAETRSATTALDFGGVISAVGPGIEHLKVGDRVAGFIPNHFGTTERVTVQAVHKMLPEEEFTVLPTLLTVYCTALVALRDRAHLRAGESILIHSGAGAFGLAAITMAKYMGATVFATVGSHSKREYLIKEMGVPTENIFNSRSASFMEDILAATGGRGVNVIVNSLVGDLMHASWSCIAPFGRFVEIGKRELIDAGKLDMRVFLKNATFTAFDLSEFFYAEDSYYQDIVYGYTAEVIEMYRAGIIKASPIATFDVAEIGQAYRYFGNKDRVGKVVVSMENSRSLIQVVPASYQSVFHPEKTYLLVGCLGGLGRSLSRWMMSRGARKFCFLGRSGCDKPSAAELVNRLRDAGASVTVVRGDVSNEDQVREAVAACSKKGPIGGVVQAAMGLSEALFSVMTNKAWHTGIQPKWKGSWNLHHALEGHDADLDFFLLTSSISGSCGTATESNYCSANGFLDSFARWRRSQGKPAVSVGLGMISEVGYLHENPDIEAMLLRKGIQPLNEDEFLQVLDYGISGPGSDSEFGRGVSMTSESAHILTGLESYGVRKLMAQGFEVNNGVMDESRTSILAASLLSEKDAKEEEKGADVGQLLAAAEWVKDVPANALSMLIPEASAPTMLDAILRLTKKRFSNLILMQLDAVDDSAPLPSFGVDSMLAAEFRTWFFNTFKIDVPFLDIVSPQKSLHTLAEFIEEKLVASWAS
ncbi:putative polyketide synthase [Trichoderma virens Gv29-8]|uniref:Highly reducing polyketide synthase virA n=1 Tax=Hypocrea virens (strain Gv29-8 / FGSC 10586) TaxID=413071 RepID=VIRA_HYPVG|nr:putative polyketide synthase [Trichoderma virens Gv29-8]G9N4B2.1 RecName: Full=Highly reducing polyketide synthase virA; Short=HRPKS virA; AltName: Full=Trichoxide biosynthesis protein virA; AltName: Full=Virensol biosynthesis cluster protein A [Trichoderma virens Gv29-8]EHK18438.1 putative polyketide synthase [Trichoderma virens Gv29-8]UKZ52649.1 Type I Iterative PKS [Trichoderma virens]